MNRILLSLLCVVFLAPGLALAANKKDTKKKEQKPRSYDKVEAVDAANNSVSITFADGTKKDYTLDAFSVVMVEGVKAKLADVKVGMKVVVVGTGTKLGRLEAEDPPVEKKDDKKKKK